MEIIRTRIRDKPATPIFSKISLICYIRLPNRFFLKNIVQSGLSIKAGTQFYLKVAFLESPEVLYKTAPEVWDGGLQVGVSGWWGWARYCSRCPTCWQTRTAPPRGPAGTRPHPSATWPSRAASRRGWVCWCKPQSITQSDNGRFPHDGKISPGWPRCYKKNYEPLLNLTGAMSRSSREKVLMCTQKRELESPL